MIKVILAFFFIFIYSCSFDKSSNYWNYNENEIIISNNQGLFNSDISFNKYKKKLLNLSENSEFPDINNK